MALLGPQNLLGPIHSSPKADIQTHSPKSPPDCGNWGFLVMFLRNEVVGKQKKISIHNLFSHGSS